MSSFAGIGEASIGGFGIGDALTAPIIETVSNGGNGTVDVSWSYTDNSTDGGVDVERSTDGFSTLTTVASGLSTATTDSNPAVEHVRMWVGALPQRVV